MIYNLINKVYIVEIQELLNSLSPEDGTVSEKLVRIIKSTKVSTPSDLSKLTFGLQHVVRCFNEENFSPLYTLFAQIYNSVISDEPRSLLIDNLEQSLIPLAIEVISSLHNYDYTQLESIQTPKERLLFIISGSQKSDERFAHLEEKIRLEVAIHLCRYLSVCEEVDKDTITALLKSDDVLVRVADLTLLRKQATERASLNNFIKAFAYGASPIFTANLIYHSEMKTDLFFAATLAYGKELTEFRYDLIAELLHFHSLTTVINTLSVSDSKLADELLHKFKFEDTEAANQTIQTIQQVGPSKYMKICERMKKLDASTHEDVRDHYFNTLSKLDVHMWGKGPLATLLFVTYRSGTPTEILNCLLELSFPKKLEVLTKLHFVAEADRNNIFVVRALINFSMNFEGYQESIKYYTMFIRNAQCSDQFKTLERTYTSLHNLDIYDLFGTVEAVCKTTSFEDQFKLCNEILALPSVLVEQPPLHLYIQVCNHGELFKVLTNYQSMVGNFTDKAVNLIAFYGFAHFNKCLNLLMQYNWESNALLFIDLLLILQDSRLEPFIARLALMKEDLASIQVVQTLKFWIEEYDFEETLALLDHYIRGVTSKNQLIRESYLMALRYTDFNHLEVSQADVLSYMISMSKGITNIEDYTSGFSDEERSEFYIKLNLLPRGANLNNHFLHLELAKISLDEPDFLLAIIDAGFIYSKVSTEEEYERLNLLVMRLCSINHWDIHTFAEVLSALPTVEHQIKAIEEALSLPVDLQKSAKLFFYLGYTTLEIDILEKALRWHHKHFGMDGEFSFAPLSAPYKLTAARSMPDVDIGQLTTFFDKLNFDPYKFSEDESYDENNGMIRITDDDSPVTRSEVRKGLQRAITHIKEKTSDLDGVPTESETRLKWYQEMHNKLAEVIEKVNSGIYSRGLLSDELIKLGVAGLHCGTRIRDGAKNIYEAICCEHELIETDTTKLSSELSELIYQEFDEQVKFYLEVYGNSHHPHIVNALITLQYQTGVPIHPELLKGYDSHDSLIEAIEIDIDEFMSAFYLEKLVSSLCEKYLKKTQAGHVMEVLTGWLNANEGAEPKAKRQRLDPYHTLEEQGLYFIGDLTNPYQTILGVLQMLLHQGVLISAAEEQS